MRAACLAMLLAAPLAGMAGNAVAAEDPPTLAGAFLRCDGSFLDRLGPAGIEESFTRQNQRKWQLAIHREVDGLEIEKIVLEQEPAQEPGNLRLFWTLDIKGEPEEIFARLASQQPPERAPMQVFMKRGKPRYVRVEFAADGRQWSSLPPKEDGTLFDEQKLDSGAVRILYFGRSRRATIQGGGAQVDSVFTSVQCALQTNAVSLKPLLRQSARWPDTIAAERESGDTAR